MIVARLDDVPGGMAFATRTAARYHGPQWTQTARERREWLIYALSPLSAWALCDDDYGVIYAWCAVDAARNAIGYCYVRRDYRREGLAVALLTAAGIDLTREVRVLEPTRAACAIARRPGYQLTLG